MCRSLTVHDECFTQLRHTNLFILIGAQLPGVNAEDFLRIGFPVTGLVEITTGSIVWSAAFFCSSSATARPRLDDGFSNELRPKAGKHSSNRRFVNKYSTNAMTYCSGSVGNGEEPTGETPALPGDVIAHWLGQNRGSAATQSFAGKLNGGRTTATVEPGIDAARRSACFRVRAGEDKPTSLVSSRLRRREVICHRRKTS
jgi:hypothetical protein